MKLAVSASEPRLDARVDERFGRAMYFVFVDDDGEEEAVVVDTYDNSEARNAMQGAGIAAAEAVSRAGAEAVLTGHLGPKAYRALAAAGIPGYRADGMTVAEAVSVFAAGALEPLEDETTEKEKR